MEKHTRRAFTPEFKAEAVALVRSSGKSTRQVARDLGLAETSLQRWVAQAETDAGHRDGLSTAEREELGQLRRELRLVREERDVLAKAIAFFATKGPTR
jgi:transposase